MSNHTDFSDIEKDLLGDDEYEQELKEKFDRKLYVSNFLENQKEANRSKFGLGMLSDYSKDPEAYQYINSIIKDGSGMLIPFAVTGLFATITYPRYVRFVKRRFGLK